MVKSSSPFSGTILLEVPEWPKGSGACLRVVFRGVEVPIIVSASRNNDPSPNDRGFDSHPPTPPSGGVLLAAICVALHLVSIRTLDELS